MTPELGRKVMAIAKGLVGSHYINGAYGATPGMSDGCPCRPGMVGLIADEKHLNPSLNAANKSANLAVKAATMTVKTYCVCAGNYANYPGPHPIAATAPDLANYLDSLKGQSPSSWRPNDRGLTPRRAFGPGQNGGDGGGKLVWAESCEGKRHFDCVGFISYCYWKASGAVVQLDISAWRTPGGDRKVYDLAKEKPASLLDGDILVKADHHIAFVGADGAIVEAQDTQFGVRANGRFSLAGTGEWTHLVRLAGGGETEYEWPYGWWRIWDGATWYYFFEPHGVVKSSKSTPYNTRNAPTKAHNVGSWSYTAPSKLVVTWRQVAGAPRPCVETFYNATDGCEQMNANSNLYSPLAATRLN